MAKKDDKEKNKSPDSRPSKAGALKGARGNKGSKGDEGTLGYGTLDNPKGSSLGYGTLDNPKGSSLGGGTETDDTTTFSSSVTADPTTSSNIPDPTGVAGTVGQTTTQTTAPTTTQTTAPTTTQTTAPMAEPPADGSTTTTTATAKTEPPQSFFDYLPTKGKDGFSALPDATTQEEAIERVKYFQETGQGLKANAARQDAKFKESFNEGKPTSPLLEDSKPLEGVERRKANQYEREARRVKDPAVRRALLLQAAQIRAGQPNITTPATKKAALDRNMQKRDVLKDTLEAGQQAAGSRGSSGARGSKGTVGRTEEDDDLLGMTGGTSSYRPMEFSPVEVILREARSRRT